MPDFSGLESRLEGIVNKLLIGGLIIACVVLVLLIGLLTENNAKLNKSYQDAYNQFDIYAIPTTDLRADVLDTMRERLFPFSWTIAQYMLTFSPDSYKDQQKGVKKFLTPNMLVAFNASIAKEREARFNQQKYQVFQQDGDPVVEVTGKRSVNGGLVRNVTAEGFLRTVDPRDKDTKHGFTIKRIGIYMEMEETAISQTNPYGFLLAKYQTKILELEK